MQISSSHVGEKIICAKDFARIMAAILGREEEIDRDKEHLWVIGVSVSLSIQYIELVSLGILSSALIHPRETYRYAISKGVASIVCAHNHPGGRLEPSRADIQVTERLRDAGDILGIELLDHIIINNEGGFVSMKELNLL